jgi:hypothetical protein
LDLCLCAPREAVDNFGEEFGVKYAVSAADGLLDFLLEVEAGEGLGNPVAISLTRPLDLALLNAAQAAASVS